MEEGAFRGFDIAMHDPGIAVITLNRPERMNGLTFAIKRDLMETLLEAQMDDSVRVVLIAGSGKAFSAGDDISDKPAAYHGKVRSGDVPEGRRSGIRTYGGMRTFSQRLNATVRQFDKLTIAAINGFAIQSGLSLALACDFRIAATDAKLGSATLRFGYQPDEGGHWLLVRHIGVARTLDFLMNKRIVSAQEALAMGLVNDVVAPEQLMERSMAMAKELAEGPQVAMRLLKRAVYNAADYTFEQAGDDIASKTAISDHHEDAVEGRASFRSHEKPKFNKWLP